MSLVLTRPRRVLTLTRSVSALPYLPWNTSTIHPAPPAILGEDLASEERAVGGEADGPAEVNGIADALQQRALRQEGRIAACGRQHRAQSVAHHPQPGRQ